MVLAAAPPPQVDQVDQVDQVAASRPPARGWRNVAALAAVVLLVAGFVVWRVSASAPAPVTRADVSRAVADGVGRAQREARQAPPDAALAYRQILPSLVSVLATDRESLGAGVVVNADGAVLTALHVVEGGGRIEVRFADGTSAPATVARQRPENDIAVLHVQRLPSVVVPAVLGGGVQVGDEVFPVGNPLGLQRTLSAGVVSALDRSVRTEGGRTLAGLIQFDAAVNPGNSGGPLLDRSGQVVGIVTGLANPSRQPYFVGIGFAVPIATAGGAAGGPAK
ncbi:MAG TPA: trypsin-like peptidase domain-containing protein [Dermatophilaceae bacterium]|nr:trypsin-like peptidase domain-containing protein [Dermatophilaceae bacterium]